MAERRGPLVGLKIVEFASIGPGPFCAMLLADLGADVIRVERPDLTPLRPFGREHDVIARGRRSIRVDVKTPAGLEIATRLIDAADALVEGYRPGVMERLGLGPDLCLARNPRLVYGRMTGFGQDGPLADEAGHDINYIAMAGALGAIGPKDGRPVPPLNLIGDYGGGGLMLAFGILAALFERSGSGRGQVVDAAMVDGAASLMSLFYGAHAARVWQGGRGSNLLDGGAPFYATYATRDGKYVAVGALEPKFFAALAAGLGLDAEWGAKRFDQGRWPELRAEMERLFLTRSRDEWAEAFAGSEACVTAVYDLDEAPRHPHNRARGTFTEVAGIVQPAPAPRFGRTPGAISAPPPAEGEHGEAILAELGYSAGEIGAFQQQGII